MVVDCLIKKKHYIPCAMDKNNSIIEAIGKLFLQNIWKLHSFPLSLTLNRGPQFISGVWKNLFKIFGIFANLSTLFHLEIDG